ncbi:MAG: hypothetical protein ACP5HQ_03110 [Thermoprotei archaeon]
MDCAVVPVNRSDFVFDSAFSTIVRVYEAFRPGRFIVLYGDFNRPAVERMEGLFREMRERGVAVNAEMIPQALSFEKFLSWLRQKVEGEKCERVFLAVTPAANITAVALTKLHDSDPDRFPLVNVVFAFGPWVGYYYPFVPRKFSQLVPLGRVPEPQTKLDLSLAAYLGDDEPAFYRDMKRLSFELNRRKTSNEGDPIELYVNDERVVSSANPDYKFVLGKLDVYLSAIDPRNSHDMAERLLRLAGAYDIKVRALNRDGTYGQARSIRDVAFEHSVVVDTNLVYNGIHSHEVRDLVIPYCVHNEILNNVNTQKNPVGEMAFYVYESLLERARVLPSEFAYCDIAIPKIDPDLIEGALVVTGDKHALNRWRKLTFSKYVTLGLVEGADEGRSEEKKGAKYEERREERVAAFIAMELGLFLSRIKAEARQRGWGKFADELKKVEIRWGKDVSVDVEAVLGLNKALGS